MTAHHDLAPGQVWRFDGAVWGRRLVRVGPAVVTWERSDGVGGTSRQSAYHFLRWIAETGAVVS